MVPSSPFSPDLVGGFYDDSSLGAPPARIDVANAEGLRFGLGYDGRVTKVSIYQTGDADVGTERAAVTVNQAAPILDDCGIFGNSGPGTGDPEVGLRIHISGDGMVTAPRLIASRVYGSTLDTTSDVFGIYAPRAAGVGVPNLGGDNRIFAGTGSGLGVAVR